MTRIKLHIGFVLTCLGGVLFLGDAPKDDISILVPSPSDSICYDAGRLFLVSASKQAGDALLLSTQWEKVQAFDLRGDSARAGFAKEFYRMFEPNMTLELLSYSFKIFKGYTPAESLGFAYTDTLDIRGLWKRAEFAKLVGDARNLGDASEVVVRVRGWIDTLCTTAYDDPVSDGRALYKLHVRLIPGSNRIFLAPRGRKEKAVSFASRFVMDSKPVADRQGLFHNSELERSCTSCHEGLPSADSGASMKADCGVCHKSMTAAPVLHAPAEMKECASCHSWSVERKMVVVEKGVPAACYDCHGEKQAEVDSSASAHPVASECLTCHSPHGSDQNHIVKEKVYSLCTGCHEDQKINHPVGRHPLQFAKVKNGDEISCVTCHNPHGSVNEHLLRFPGGRMGVCAQCH
ncbi:MAG TPA: cytochrome c3 family protein [Bacteroidota bacterium]|jgi:predicted CXXCH cytochrome family protein